ncbi:(2Fe-2S)-binding protein [Jatrophihabitans sp. DSM 45814]
MTVQVDRSEVEAAIAVAARLGPFFEVDLASRQRGNPVPSAGPVAPPWIPLRELASEPAHARDRVRRAKTLMMSRLDLPESALPDRVIASIVFLGLSARLFAPSYGCLLLTGVSPSLTIDDVSWQAVDGGAMPLLVSSSSGIRDDRSAPQQPSKTVRDHLLAHTISNLIEPILTTFSREFRLSKIILWGNVASGVSGAARASMLIDPKPGPEDRRAAAALAAGLLETEPLANAADVPDIDDENWQPRRRSCCLFYRVPGAGTCGDCVLDGKRSR